ncbi:MAG: alpha/beta fold hydrolase [Corynebacterium sp.]|nr:alpha/beta fold hydrolase [Corynebacterium sp.]
MNTSRHFGLNIVEHTLTRPWDTSADSSRDNTETFTLFARELYRDGGENKPALLYLQGGPGYPSPRPVGAHGWIGQALDEFRVILLDQRGTGRSGRIDAANLDSAPDFSLLRQEHIVADAEALREHLGLDTWSLLGQSYGGFCITTYLSTHADRIKHAYLTGGLPGLNASVDDVYNLTFDKLKVRHDRFYREYPWTENTIREICHHLDNSCEVLPTGERLSSRRFRTIGIELGRTLGFHTLAYLLEEPFHANTGTKRLRTDFLTAVGARVSFAQAPLYAAIHESIYGGIGATATKWSAHRIRETKPGFAETADPTSNDPFYLTGEHIFPWQFDEDPSLQPFKQRAEALARYEWKQGPYHRQALVHAPVSAAAIYLDDIFVPFELSMDTAAAYGDLRPHVSNQFEHDGLGHDGAGLFTLLRTKVDDH